jgi:lipopolysaccharide transport protein LptA
MTLASKSLAALACAAALALAAPASAQSSTPNGAATKPARAAKPGSGSKPRVSGPITITAKAGEWQDGVMIYTGDVVMLSKTLELRGARLELTQKGGKKSPYEITVTGAPATLKHLGEQAADPVVNGRATTMVYRSATQTVQLTGDAHLDRAKDEIDGEDIRYDVAARRVQASGGEKGQVRIVIDVPEDTP